LNKNWVGLRAGLDVFEEEYLAPAEEGKANKILENSCIIG
jgi:hypothetical protein